MGAGQAREESRGAGGPWPVRAGEPKGGERQRKEEPFRIRREEEETDRKERREQDRELRDRQRDPTPSRAVRSDGSGVDGCAVETGEPVEQPHRRRERRARNEELGKNDVAEERHRDDP